MCTLLFRKNFNLIGCRKIEAVYGALKLGYDVIFSDVDIAWIRDPIDHVFIPGVDYVHSSNNGCNKKWMFNDTMEGNTGIRKPLCLSFVSSSTSTALRFLCRAIESADNPHL